MTNITQSMKKNNRFDALKTEKPNVFTTGRRGRTNSSDPPRPQNSRWRRDDDQKSNSFTNPQRRRGRNNNRQKKFKKSEKFANAEKDIFGAPLIQGATQRGLNLGNIMMSERPKREKKKKKKKRAAVIEEEVVDINEGKTQEEIDQEREWHRQFLIQCQMETDSEEEEEDEESKSDLGEKDE